jgi:hypothetical protein
MTNHNENNDNVSRILTGGIGWGDSYAETFSPHGYRSFTADGRRVADGKLADVLASVAGLAGWQIYAVDSTGAVGSLVAADEV